MTKEKKVERIKQRVSVGHEKEEQAVRFSLLTVRREQHRHCTLQPIAVKHNPPPRISAKSSNHTGISQLWPVIQNLKACAYVSKPKTNISVSWLDNVRLFIIIYYYYLFSYDLPVLVCFYLSEGINCYQLLCDTALRGFIKLCICLLPNMHTYLYILNTEE